MKRTGLFALPLLATALLLVSCEAAPASQQAGPSGTSPSASPDADPAPGASGRPDPTARQPPGPAITGIEASAVTLETGGFDQADVQAALAALGPWLDAVERNPDLFHSQPKTEADFASLLPLHTRALRAELVQLFAAYRRSPLNDGTDTSEVTAELAEIVRSSFAVLTTTSYQAPADGQDDNSIDLGDELDPDGAFGPVTVTDLVVSDYDDPAGVPVLRLTAEVETAYRVLEDQQEKDVRIVRTTVVDFDTVDGPLLVVGFQRKLPTATTTDRA